MAAPMTAGKLQTTSGEMSVSAAIKRGHCGMVRTGQQTPGAAEGRTRWPESGLAAPSGPSAGQAALRFKPLSANAVSFLSVSFSSSSVCWSKETQSLRPSCLAHAMSVP